MVLDDITQDSLPLTRGAIHGLTRGRSKHCCNHFLNGKICNSHCTMTTMMMAIVALTAQLATADVGSHPIYPPCMPSMTCFQISPYPDDSLVFDCAAVNSSIPTKGNVYFMHGNDGPRSKGMWSLIMQRFAAEGYNTLACDQRGFSPGASPYVPTAYNYDFLAQDIFAIADNYFGVGGKFHVVAHDQGARVGWHALRAVGSGRSRFASYSPLSEAHSDAFSDALYGPNPDPVQQLNFQYLRQFTLNNSVLTYEQNIWHRLCQQPYGYKTPRACQTAIWWYQGAIASGNLAVQPFTGIFGPIGTMFGIPASFVKEHTPYPLNGLPQRTKVGEVKTVPVFYICGASDLADKCTDRFRDATAKLVTNFKYLRLEACGHDLTTPQQCSEYEKVVDGMVNFVKSVA